MIVTAATPSAPDGSIETESEPSQWEKEMFLLGDTAGRLTNDPIDVTGRARFLVYGPYVHMEPGRWRVIVSLDLSPDAARNPLALQFGVDPVVTTVDMALGVAGPQQFRIDHVVHTAGPGQVRLWLKRAAFHGEIRFSGATVRRLGNVVSAPSTT